MALAATPFPREILLHVVKSLPAAPQILARLGQLQLNPDSDLSDVTALLRCDAALTVRIIRIANSAAYNIGAPYSSLEGALARVGFGEVYRIAGFAAVAQLTEKALRLYGVAGPQLRENSLLTALLMEELAASAGLEPQEAYTAGLLRSTGKIALDGLTRDPSYKGRYEGPECGPLAQWETGFTGISNCEAAAFVLTEWRFPSGIIAAINQHYLPRPASSPLAHLLNLAAGAAARCGHGLPGEQSYWELGPEKFKRAGVNETQLEDAITRVQIPFELLRPAVG